MYFLSVLSVVNPAIAALKRPKSLTERNWPSANPALYFPRGPRVGPRQRSAYRGKAAIFSLRESPMAYRGFFLSLGTLAVE
jgi:hypothetical protein